MSVLEFLLLSVIAITGFVGPLLMVRVRGHARAFAAMLIADCVLAIVSLLGLRDGAADAWPELGGVVAVGGALFLLVIPWALRRLGGFAASRGRLRWARRLADVRELLQPGMGAGVERQLLATLEKINQGKSQEVVDELLTARAAARNENERLHVDEQIVLILAYACRWQDAIHHYHAQLVSRPANRVSQLDVEMIRAHHEVSDIDGAARCLARLEEFGNGAPEWLRNQARLVFLSFAGRWEAVERLVARLHRAGFLPKPGLAYWSGLARVRGGDVARGRALLLGAVRGGDGRSRSCAQAEIARLDRGENPRDVWDAQAKQLLDKVEASIALMPDLGTAMPTGGPRRSVATASLLAANVAVAIAA